MAELVAGGKGVIEAILRRRSLAPRKLVAPGPDASQLELLISAAVAAPDHGRLHPVRFVQIADAGRATLAQLFRQAASQMEPQAGPELADREAEKAHHAPCLLAVVARIDDANPVAPAHEQWISVGAAVQNILLAAEDLGFRAMIVSGRKVQSRLLQAAFAPTGSEHLVGFVAIGTPTAEPSPRDRHPGSLAHWSGT